MGRALLLRVLDAKFPAACANAPLFQQLPLLALSLPLLRKPCENLAEDAVRQSVHCGRSSEGGLERCKLHLALCRTRV